MVRVTLGLSLCALPFFLSLIGDAEALSPLTFSAVKTHETASQTKPVPQPLGSPFDGFGFIGAGACSAVPRQVIDKSNRVRTQTIQVCE